MKKNVIEIENLKTYFDVSKGFLKGGKDVVRAVDDISFEIAQGKSLGLIGEYFFGNLMFPSSLQYHSLSAAAFRACGSHLRCFEYRSLDWI